MLERDVIEKLLDTYELSEIIELNDLTESDVLEVLVKHSLIHLPDTLPVDL